MKRLAVINVVGLTEALIGEHTPRIAGFRKRGALANIAPAFPAVTCTAQSNYLTGTMPSQHGIVGNGWYNRELAEVQFWKQSNHLVHGDKIWDELRTSTPDPGTKTPTPFAAANCFWWFNMYSTRGLFDHAAPDVSRRWPENFRYLFLAIFHPHGNQARPRRISVLRFLGAGGRSGFAAGKGRLRLALDCRIREMD